VVDFTEYDDEKIYGDYESDVDVVEVPNVQPEKEKSVTELFMDAFKPKS